MNPKHRMNRVNLNRMIPNRQNRENQSLQRMENKRMIQQKKTRQKVVQMQNRTRRKMIPRKKYRLLMMKERVNRISSRKKAPLPIQPLTIAQQIIALQTIAIRITAAQRAILSQITVQAVQRIIQQVQTTKAQRTIPGIPILRIQIIHLPSITTIRSRGCSLPTISRKFKQSLFLLVIPEAANR